MKSFIAVLAAIFIFSLTVSSQEMKSHQHQKDTTKAEKHMKHKQRKDNAKIVKYTCPMHPDVITNKPGKCPKCGMTLVKMEVKKMKEVTKKTMEMKFDVYTCPMHPDVKSDKPGKCPKCKMDLVKEKVDK